MRHFPRTGRSRALLASLAALAVATPVAVSTTPLASADELRDKQRNVERRIDHAHDDLGESSKHVRRATLRYRKAQEKLAKAKAELRKVQGELDAAEVRDTEMQEKLDGAKQRLRDAQGELDQGTREANDQQDALERTVVDMYGSGDPQLLGMAGILESGDASQMMRRQSVVDSIVNQETSLYQDLEATRVLLGVRRDQVSDAKDEVAQRRRAAATHLTYMEELTARTEDAKSSVTTLVNARAGARKAAEAAYERDQAELDRLKQESDRISQLLRDRADRGGDGDGGNDGGGSGSGYLDYPVDGYVTSPFGYRVHPIYGYRSLHDGVDFGAGCGSPMYAAAGGTVIEQYYQTAYGNRLILDHGMVQGHGLASIYNHATKYVVGPGDRVQRGDLIGYVGSTGWSTGCHLHYTVMQDGTAVDPMNWL